MPTRHHGEALLCDSHRPGFYAIGCYATGLAMIVVGAVILR